jgi:hypothetical protein
MMRAQQMGQGSVGPYRLLPPLCAMLVASGKGGRRTALALQARSCGGADGGEPIPCCNLVALTCQLPFSQRRSRKVLRPWLCRRSKQGAGKAQATGRTAARATARPCGPLTPPLFRPGRIRRASAGTEAIALHAKGGAAPAAAGRAQRRRSAAARICGPPPPLSSLGGSGEDLREKKEAVQAAEVGGRSACGGGTGNGRGGSEGRSEGRSGMCACAYSCACI